MENFHKSVVPVIESVYDSFTNAERTVANFFITNIDAEIDFSAQNVSQILHVSEASITRFSNWIRVIPMGLAWAVVYYLVFRFVMKKFAIAVPGSEIIDAESAPADVAPIATGSSREAAHIIIEALGSAENIENITACATRLRVSVADSSKVDKDTIKNLGATAVFDIDGGVHAVFGGKANIYSQEINQILGTDD